MEWIRALAFDRLDLRGVTLVGQDWGGLIGLRLAAEHPGRFARVVAANTGLPTGDQPMPDVWLRFREVVRTAPELSVSRLVQSGCQTRLSRTRCWPPTMRRSPTSPSWPAVRAMPDLVPTTPDDPATAANRAAWQRLAAWDKPFLVAFSDATRSPGRWGRCSGTPCRARRGSSTRCSPGPAISCRRTRVNGSAP